MESHNHGSYIAKTPSPGAIDWGHINFPPCFRVAHFSLNEVQGAVKRFALKVYISFLIIFAVLLINRKYFTRTNVVLSSIIQVSLKYSPGINILYSVLSMKKS